MPVPRFATIGAALGLCLVAGSLAQIVDLPERRQRRIGGIVDSDTNTVVFDVNGFHVESSRTDLQGADHRPNGDQLDMLFVTTSTTFRTVLSKGPPVWRGGALSVFHRETHIPMLSAGDENADGVFDTVSYSKVDETGKPLLQVVDYEADGQLDMRVNFVEGYQEIWHAERWYRIEDREGRWGIVLNGEFVELAATNYRLAVP